MRNRINTIVFGLLLATQLCQVRVLAQQPTRMRQIAAFYRHRDGFMGTVAVARNGRIVFEKSYGYAKLEQQIPFAQDTRFPIGSVSKQITAAAILLLQQDGKLTTGDTIARFYDRAPAAWGRITLRNLLTQTSGIPDFDFAEAVRHGPRLPQTNIETVIEKPLKFEPGTAFDYSNVNYLLLGMVVERASGEPYCRFLQERIFAPLRLTQTGCGWRSGFISRSASGYRPAAKGFVPAENDDLTSISGAGSLYSTAHDLVRWTSALHGGRLLKQSSLREMTHPFLRGYAYGLEIDGSSRIGHNGAVDGFYSAIDYLPRTRMVVLVLSNVNLNGNESSPGAFAMEAELIELTLDQHAILPSEGKELYLPHEVLRRYVGRYKATAPRNPVAFEVSSKGDHLFFQLSGGNPSVQLRAESQANFYVVDQEVEIDFDMSGTAVVIDYNGHSATQFIRQEEQNTPKS
jgi:CubicO group peptidase (beta-lactamase class C family)